MKKFFIISFLLFINIFSIFAIGIEQPIEMRSIEKTKSIIFHTKKEIFVLEKNMKNYAPQVLREKKMTFRKI